MEKEKKTDLYFSQEARIAWNQKSKHASSHQNTKLKVQIKKHHIDLNKGASKCKLDIIWA